MFRVAALKSGRSQTQTSSPEKKNTNVVHESAYMLHTSQRKEVLLRDAGSTGTVSWVIFGPATQTLHCAEEGTSSHSVRMINTTTSI